MTFKLEPNPTFRATAEISQPGEGAEPLRLPLIFRHMSRKQYDAEIVEAKLSVDDAVRRLVVGWEVPGVEFTAERLDKLMDDQAPGSGEIFATWLKESRESKRKN